MGLRPLRTALEHGADPTSAVRGDPPYAAALPVLYGLLVASAAIFFTLTGNLFSLFIMLPTAMMAWFMLVRPGHRRRYRRAIADLPRWELHPE